MSQLNGKSATCPPKRKRGRPLLYNNNDDRRKARLETRRMSYFNAQELNPLGTGNNNKPKHSKHAPSMKSVSRTVHPQPPDVIKHVQRPALRLKPDSNLRRAMAAIWRRVTEPHHQLTGVEVLQPLYDSVLTVIRTNTRDMAVAILTDTNLHVKDAIKQAERVRDEAHKRDPTYFSEAVKLYRDLQRVDMLYYECSLWFKHNGLTGLLAKVQEGDLLWQLYIEKAEDAEGKLVADIM
ncbi:hypothetical protein M422DRAFT_49481 [Sphaerobolus stellatus SS14]|uniref:Uncharacterized protein n=1 Tax=Sphaerobolus stellatus (strain SS14) TaxID=990650 RepID=A0A0C9VNT9_SPHS4|nr:hypothetical protein M422DRAFT_49481 [Sphaerobolus stellatus SS14]